MKWRNVPKAVKNPDSTTQKIFVRIYFEKLQMIFTLNWDGKWNIVSHLLDQHYQQYQHYKKNPILLSQYGIQWKQIDLDKSIHMLNI